MSATTAEPQNSWTDIKAPGTHVPGVIKAGTYYTRRGKEFWYVIADAKFLTLELHDEPYQKIVLTLDGHEDWANRINSNRNLYYHAQSTVRPLVTESLGALT